MKIDGKKLALALLTLVAVGVLVRGALFLQRLDEPLRAQPGDIVLIRAGQSLTSVANALAERGILAHPLDFRLYARLDGQASRIRAGEYALSPTMTPRTLLRKLVAGEVVYHQVRLLEGWTALQAVAAVQANPLIETTLVVDDEESLRLGLGLDVHPEGQFFPETYNFTRGTSDREILLRAHALMQQVLAEEWEARDVGLPYESPYDALIMASLVEKETGMASERAQIAGVFVRRLQLGMRLQTDPSVIYGLGATFDGNLTRAHLREDGDYNTYARGGLPPTPIALPGRAAIAASLRPEEGEALFFVAKGDGSHYFSSTLEEHNAAVRQYQVEGRAADYRSRPPEAE